MVVNTIEPTKNEIFNELRNQGCTWLCGMGSGCGCYLGIKRMGCYDRVKEELRRTETTYTPEELEEIKIRIKNNPNSAENCLKEFFANDDWDFEEG